MIAVIDPSCHYHAALYIRLSREDENDGPSQSVTNQKSLLDEFVQQNQIDVYDTYIDDGWSGTNFNRPDFQRMVHDIERQKVNMVITKDLSRLGRDYILTGHYMERYFPEHGVRYISLLDGIDTGVESSANDITPFRAIMNDMYAKDISRKIRSVKHDKQRKGEFIGGKAVYGYRRHPTEKNRIVIDPEAAAVVRKVFAMALEGMSCRGIAAQLNAQGIPTPAVYAGLRVGRCGPYTGLWSSERISEMLQNETYTGKMVQGRTIKISYKSGKSRRQPPEKWIVVEGTHDPIIAEDTFDRVQRLVSSRRYTRSRTYDFLLKGLIFCHECGYPLGVVNRRNASGEDVLYFVCRTYQRFTGSGVCTCHSMKEQVVTAAVLEKAREICEVCLAQTELQAAAEAALEKAEKRNSAEYVRQTLQNRCDSLTVQMDQMYRDRLRGLLEETDFVRLYQGMKEERGALEKELQQWECGKKRSGSREDRAKELVQRFWESGCTNREMLVSMMERIEMTEDKRLMIRFRFQEPEWAGKQQ